MNHRKTRHWWLICLLLLGGTACSKSGEGALEAYSKASPPANKKLRVFVDVCQETKKRKGRKAILSHLESRCIPALKNYILALEDIPTGTKRLKEIHEYKVTTYKEWLKALEHFAKEAKDLKGHILGVESLVEKSKRFHKRAKDYKDYMRTYIQDLQTGEE